MFQDKKQASEKRRTGWFNQTHQPPPPMNTETVLPPLALALGRLRQPRPAAPRAWPYAPRAAATAPTHDFLVVAPADALLGDETFNRETTPAAAIPGAEAARTYWFDL